MEQAASEIQKLFLAVSNDEKRTWTPQQAWQLVKLLAKADSLRYNEILLSDVYKTGGDTALTALEQSELITIQSYNGRPYSVKAGRPVFAAAFKHLVDDAVLSSKLDLAVLAESIKVETQTIEKCEQELHLLGELPKQPAELTGRIQWLLKKIQASCEKKKQSAVKIAERVGRLKGANSRAARLFDVKVEEDQKEEIDFVDWEED